MSCTNDDVRNYHFSLLYQVTKIMNAYFPLITSPNAELRYYQLSDAKLTTEYLKTFKIRMVANIGTFAGRAIPVIGWIILAADVSIITINAMTAYNKIARLEDRL